MTETNLSHRGKVVLMVSTIALSFFTSMSKVLVPGVVFDDLQILGLNAGAIAGLGAVYMWSYSISQLTAGMLSGRLGGLRLLLAGGASFVAGSVLFPLCSYYPLLVTARILAGIGAGTVFLGLAMLIAELFPDRLTVILSVAMFLGYLGPIVGMSPMTWLIGLLKWRMALLVPAVLAGAAFAGIFLMSLRCPRSRDEKAGAGLQVMLAVVKVGNNRRLFLASSVIFGAYYALLTVAGQKCLQDCCGMSRMQASIFVTILAMIVAVNNLFTDAVMKRFAGHRKRLLFLASGCCLAGSLLGAAAFQLRWPAFLVVTAFVLLAIPAGFFTIFSVIAREFNPPENFGMAMSLLNFFGFVAIALEGNLTGMLLNRHEGLAKKIDGLTIYPPEAYRDMFLLFVVCALAGAIACIGIREKRSAAGR